MQERLENGLVVRVTGGEVWVRVGPETLACSQRGRGRFKGSAVAVVAGDQVSVLRDATGGASLEAALPRTSWLSRYVERESGDRVVVANIDRLFVVTAAADPPPRSGFLDRVLASAEWGHITPCIILNKMDLAEPGQADLMRAVYVPSGRLGARPGSSSNQARSIRPWCRISFCRQRASSSWPSVWPPARWHSTPRWASWRRDRGPWCALPSACWGWRHWRC